MAKSDVIWVNEKALATLLEDVPASVKFEEDGIAGAELSYTCKWTVAAALVKKVKWHPDYGWLKRKSATITRQEAGIAKVKLTFEGIDPTGGPDSQGVVKTYSMKGASSTAPVTTHPDFDKIAGTSSETAKPGAKFKMTGEGKDTFVEFTVGKLTAAGMVRNERAGMVTYHQGGLVFSEVATYGSASTTRHKASMDKLGYIDDPPEVEKYVDLESKVNWLLTGCSIDDVGGGVKVTRTWLCSGRNGWDEEFYEKGHTF